MKIELNLIIKYSLANDKTHNNLINSNCYFDFVVSVVDALFWIKDANFGETRVNAF